MKAGAFKKRLQYYMLKGGFTPTSLSRKAKLNITAVRDILVHEGTPNPRIDTFSKLCRALGVLPHQLHPEFEKFYAARQSRPLAPLKKKDKSQ